MSRAQGGMRTAGEVVTWWLGKLEGDRSRSIPYRRSMASLMRRLACVICAA